MADQNDGGHGCKASHRPSHHAGAMQFFIGVDGEGGGKYQFVKRRVRQQSMGALIGRRCDMRSQILPALRGSIMLRGSIIKLGITFPAKACHLTATQHLGRYILLARQVRCRRHNQLNGNRRNTSYSNCGSGRGPVITATSNVLSTNLSNGAVTGLGLNQVIGYSAVNAANKAVRSG